MHSGRGRTVYYYELRWRYRVTRKISFPAKNIRLRNLMRHRQPLLPPTTIHPPTPRRYKYARVIRTVTDHNNNCYVGVQQQRATVHLVEYNNNNIGICVSRDMK